MTIFESIHNFSRYSDSSFTCEPLGSDAYALLCNGQDTLHIIFSFCDKTTTISFRNICDTVDVVHPCLVRKIIDVVSKKLYNNNRSFNRLEFIDADGSIPFEHLRSVSSMCTNNLPHKWHIDKNGVITSPQPSIVYNCE